MENWPTRYRCPYCTRITNQYPIFCDKKECPIKKDWVQDNWFGLLFLVVLILFFMILFLA